MLNWLELSLLILATYRLSRLISIDDGPFDLMFKFRVILGGYDLDENGIPSSWIGRGIQCVHCVGFWIALLITIAYTSIYHYWIFLAIAGGQSFLWSMNNR